MKPISLSDYKAQQLGHLRGSARCLHCGHSWQVVTVPGTVSGFECSQCGFGQGVLEGLLVPENRFVCDCGSDLYFILKEGCMCILCGVMAEGF
jgi:hypothetical protein